MKTSCATPTISPGLLRWFGWYARRCLAQHFHSLRILRSGTPPPDNGQPSVFFLNHPSWWDPLVALHLALTFHPGQHAYGPIDATALHHYPILQKVGFFAVEKNSLQGARKFRQHADAILAQPHHALWLTPQGRFTDVRERPVRLAAGVGHLARRKHRGVMFVPVAIEYAWWHERGAEALVAFGPAVDFAATREAAGYRKQCEAALAAVQDRLAAASMQRDPTLFQVLISGTTGVGGVYDLWRRMRATVRGERFDPRHASEQNP